MNFPARSYYLLYALLPLGFIGLWLLIPHPDVSLQSDQSSYSGISYALSKGQFIDSRYLDSLNLHDISHPFYQRLGVTLPVAAIYKALGVNTLTTYLWPLCVALLILFTVCAALPDVWSRIWGLLLGVTCLPLLKNATALLPDIIVAAFIGLAALLLYRRRLVGNSGNNRVSLFSLCYPLATGLCLFMAFLSKLSVVWFLPLYIMILAHDGWRQERLLLWRFHVPLMITVAILGSAYLLWSALIFGDPLFRFNGIEAVSKRHLWHGSPPSLEYLLKERWMVVGKAVVKEYGLLIWPALITALAMPEKMRFWILYTLCMFLCFGYSSASLSQYQLLPVMPDKYRMFLPLLPGILILAAWILARIRIPSHMPATAMFNLVVLAVLSYPLWQQARGWEGYASIQSVAQEATQIIKQTLGQESMLLITATNRSARNLRFYFGWQYPPNLTVLSAHNLTIEQLQNHNSAFIYANRDMANFVNQTYGRRDFIQPIEQLVARLSLRPLFDKSSIALWQTDTPTDLKPLVEPSSRAIIDFSAIPAQPKDGTRWNAPGNIVIAQSDSLKIRINNDDITGNILELSLDNNDDYAVILKAGDKAIWQERIVASRKHNGLVSYQLPLPADVDFGKVDQIEIKPLSGDGKYSLGHIRFLQK